MLCATSCLTRPVLLARLDALMRRAAPDAQAKAKRPMSVEHRPYRIDFGAQTATVEGVRIELTPKELDLTWVPFSNLERFVSKAELIASVWGKRAEICSHTVTQHMHVLRTKLRLRKYGYRLGAVYGSGYRLTVSALVA